MKGKILKKVIAAALVLTLVSGGMPIQPLSQVFEDIAITANAETTTSTINVGGTDYMLCTGFTATGGNGTNYAKLVDGNTSTDWHATKSIGELTDDFTGGTEDPAFVEFHADEAFIPKGYVLTCDHENAGFWKPVEWALKAKLNESDEWTTIQSSTTTLGEGKTFEIACSNDGDNPYQYFRFEVYEVGVKRVLDLDELQIYGSLPAYTHLTVKAATCMATGIKQECYRRNSDGKYFTDETGATELAESDVIAPIAAHTGVHHEATDTHIEYWQCSMCSKYFSNEDCTTEITEEDTKIYRTITIDNSISGLVTVGFGRTQALAGETVLLFVADDRIDASTLKVNDGAVEVAHDRGDWYKFTMPAADVTVTAEVVQSNVDGDILTGSIKHRVTITDGASITLNNATISGSIVCEGSATITLVGTNSVSGATNKAGIQIGGSGTTLTIRGEGSLTVNGGDLSAGIGLSSLMNYDSNVSSGDIVIEGGTITATGGRWGAGIGIGTVKNTNNDNSTSVQFGNITIKGGTVTAIGGDSGNGIGKGYSYSGPTISIGTVTIYDGIDKVDASSIKDFSSVVYMHGENDVTASKTDYFAIAEDGDQRIIKSKHTITVADNIINGTVTAKVDESVASIAVSSDTVTLTVTPDDGYAVKSVTAGSAEVTKVDDTTYTFTMPAENVTVSAEFIRLPFVNVNVTGGGTVTYDDNSAVDGGSFEVITEKGAEIPLILTPDSGYTVKSVEYGYTNKYGTNMRGAQLPISDGTATLTVPNDLKDGTGVTITVTFASALVGGADEASAVALTDNTVTDLAGGWYKVESDITFDHTLNLLGDTHLVIADGATMTVSTASGTGIDSDYTLNVSGAGTLNVTGTGEYSIAIRVGSYVQTGAVVTASGFIGIRCCDDFDTVVTNDFTFNGGQLTATGTSDGIRADNTITLGYTSANDFIQASSYDVISGGTIKVADGKALTDGTDEYSSTLSNNDIVGKKLTPVAKTLTLPTTIANGTLTADQTGNVLVGDTVTLTVTPDTGYQVKSVSVNGAAIEAVNGVYSFTMPDGDVTVSAEFEEITQSYIAGASLTLTGDISVNLYMNFSKALLEDSDAYMLIKGPNDSAPVKYLLSELKNDDNKYVAKCRVNAAQMGENVTFELYNGAGEKQIFWNTNKSEEFTTFTYSVNSYINTVKGGNDKLAALAQAMQNYGAWARQYLTTKGKMSNVAEIANPTAVDNVTVTDLEPYAVKKSDGFSVNNLNMSLFVESETTLRLYYAGDPITVTATRNGDSVTVYTGTKNSMNYVEVRNISATDLGKTITFDFGTAGTVEVSALSYAYAILNAYNGNEAKTNICNTVKALYKYYTAAKAYFE